MVCNLYVCGVYHSEILYLNVTEHCTRSQKSKKTHHLVFNGCLMVKYTIIVIECNRVELLGYK